MRLFDYIYYRWFLLYKKTDSDPDLYASGIVTAYQNLTIINIVLLVKVIVGGSLPPRKYILVMILILFTVNYFRYERGLDFSKLENRGAMRPKRKESLK